VLTERRKRESMFIRSATWIGLVCLLAAPPGWSQPVGDAIQGGFRLFDSESPLREAGVISLGPLVLGAARVQVEQAGVCRELVFALLGNEGSKRGSDFVKVKQKDHVVAFFTFSDCVGGEKTCLQGASEPVAVSGCSGTIRVLRKEGISGSAKVRCKDGIPPSDPAFGLTAQEQMWASEAFPDLAEKFQLKLKKPAGEQIDQESLDFKVQNVNVDALDDVVGTYLADDELPLCAAG
jgi:hypothetical protein